MASENNNNSQLINGSNSIQQEDPVKAMIEGYKNVLATKRLDNEVYKWELVNEFKGRPNTDAPDFTKEIKSIKFSNLIYAMGVAVINHIAREKPEELRVLFKYLFDSSKDLPERFDFFKEESLKLYRSLGETLSHHQDERTIATYLTYHNPQEYTFYKSSFYKAYCKLLNIKEAGKNKKYAHYLALLKQLIEKYIEPDAALINLVKIIIPEYYDGTNHLLLAQDILYEMLENKEQNDYWVFQGNPKIYDIVGALNDNELNAWRVKAHEDKIKQGDKIILWVTGKEPGCYALAEVTSEVFEGLDEEPELKYYTENSVNEVAKRVKIKITHNLANNPITKEQIESEAELADLKVGNQGTNFVATKEQYDTLLDIISSKSSSAYVAVKKNLDQDKLKSFLAILRDFIKANSLYPNDERLSFNVRKNKNRLVFLIGNRYSFSINKLNNKTMFSFISKEVLSKEYEDFKSPLGVIEAHWNIIENLNGYENNINEGLLTELERSNKCAFRKYTNQDFINDVYQITSPMNQNQTSQENLKIEFIDWLVANPTSNYFTNDKQRIEKALDQYNSYFDEDIYNCSIDNFDTILRILDKTLYQDTTNRFLEFSKGNSSHQPRAILGEQNYMKFLKEKFAYQPKVALNIILYGPPGTGKTYKTIFKAAEIVENRKIENFEEAKRIFNDKLNSQIEFITFHQNYSYEDFIQGLRPDVENEGSLSFERKDGVFKRIADRALNNIKESEKVPEEISKSIAFVNALEALKDQVIEAKNPIKINETAYFIAAEDDAFRYTADNWTLNDKGFNGFRMKYSDLIKFNDANVQTRKDIKELSNVSGLAKQHASYFIKTFEIIKGLVSNEALKIKVVTRNNYVIIIDEINRANISRVFGELITLIEPDKRSHGSVPLKCTLPSGEDFIVPSNLYIIGTMNTADKSIALLDIALRRRFEFEAMYPDYDLEGIRDTEILKKINTEIIKLKGYDFQIGHSYFMESKDDPYNLVKRMNKKVIPLLLEYFMNNKEEVEKIIKAAGLNLKVGSWPLEITE